MNYQQRIIQAYRNTPWRIQLQIIGLFSASLVFIAIIGSVYLNVSARASTIGRRVQSIQATQEVVEREIEDLETHLADITSAEAMAKRADEAGYEVASPQKHHLPGGQRLSRQAGRAVGAGAATHGPQHGKTARRFYGFIV